MKGGEGVFDVRQIVPAALLEGAGRQFAYGQLKPRASVGRHTHENDIEICYFLKGTGTVIDDGVPTEVGAGDCNIVPRHHSHEIVNSGTESLEYIALVLYPRS
jgi:mannose-6-phosphate isomerase-like protein (cupin superfamily)